MWEAFEGAGEKKYWGLLLMDKEKNIIRGETNKLTPWGGVHEWAQKGAHVVFAHLHHTYAGLRGFDLTLQGHCQCMHHNTP